MGNGVKNLHDAVPLRTLGGIGPKNVGEVLKRYPIPALRQGHPDKPEHEHIHPRIKAQAERVNAKQAGEGCGEDCQEQVGLVV